VFNKADLTSSISSYAVDDDDAGVNCKTESTTVMLNEPFRHHLATTADGII
jgi:hypothetical protein